MFSLTETPMGLSQAELAILIAKLDLKMSILFLKKYVRIALWVECVF